MSRTPFPFAIDNIGSAIDRLPNRYSRVGELGIFSARPQATTKVTLIYRDNEIVLLDPVARSADRQELNRERKNSITFDIPSYKLGDVITPEDIQNITAFAAGDKQLENMADAYNRRLQKIRNNHDQTFEFIRMQALKGIIVDPYGNEMHNLFSEFGITQTTVDFDLGNAASDILGHTKQLNDHLANNLHGETSNGTHALVSSDFLHKLRTHPNYEKYLLSHSAALEQIAASRASHSDPNARRSVFIDGVTFESYTGQSKNGAGDTVKFIADGEGHAFPMGTNETFLEFDAPPNRMDAVNVAPSEEIAVYPKDLDQAKGIDLDTESNKIALCARPELLVKVKA